MKLALKSSIVVCVVAVVVCGVVVVDVGMVVVLEDVLVDGTALVLVVDATAIVDLVGADVCGPGVFNNVSVIFESGNRGRYSASVPPP